MHTKLVENPTGKIPLGRQRCRWEHKIETDPTEQDYWWGSGLDLTGSG